MSRLKRLRTVLLSSLNSSLAFLLSTAGNRGFKTRQLGMLDHPRFVECHAPFTNLQKYTYISTYLRFIISSSDVSVSFHGSSSAFSFPSIPQWPRWVLPVYICVSIHAVESQCNSWRPLIRRDPSALVVAWLSTHFIKFEAGRPPISIML